MKPNKSILINFILVCVFILAGWFLVIAPYSKFQNLIQKLPELVNTNLIENFPNDLKISIKNGVVSFNKPSPYCLTPPNKTASVDRLPWGVVLDVKATADISVLESGEKYSKLCKAIALVGKDFILFPDKGNTYRYSKISETISFDIDKSVIKKYTDQYLPLVAIFGQRVYFILPISLIPLLFVMLLSQNYWYSLVVRFAVKRLKIKELSFGESYRLSLFFYNFLLFIDLVIIKFGLNFLLKQDFAISFPFLNTIVILVTSIMYLTKTQTPEIPKETPTLGIPMGASPIPPYQEPTQPTSTSNTYRVVIRTINKSP